MTTLVMEAPRPDSLSELYACLRESNRQIARAVLLAGELAGTGVAEQVEGMPLDLALGVACGLTGADRSMVITAGEIMAAMPTLARLFSEGAVSWGVVRAVVVQARRMGREQRRALDDRLAATLERDGGLADDPDRVVAMIDAAADDLRRLDSLERAERRRQDAAFLAVQGRLDGGIAYHGVQPDPARAAAFLNELDAHAARLRAEAEPREPAEPSTRAGQLAEALHDLVTGDGEGGGGGGQFVVRVDATDDAEDAATPASVDVPVAGPRQRATASYAEVLARRGGSVRVVIYRGGQPVAVTHPVHITADDGGIGYRLSGRGPTTTVSPTGTRRGMPLLRAAAAHALDHSPAAHRAKRGERPLGRAALTGAADTPTLTRLAVLDRDQGCRWPGCRAPADWCDVHHIRWRAEGGNHDPRNLVSLCRRHHTLVHDLHWHLRLHPDTAELTGRRHGRVWTTRPNTIRLARAPTPPVRGPDPPRGHRPLPF
jgi:hypothetical protein